DCWPAVLAQIERSPQPAPLRRNAAGAVSARQGVLAAFIGDRVAGHLTFHVEPRPVLVPDPPQDEAGAAAEVQPETSQADAPKHDASEPIHGAPIRFRGWQAEAWVDAIGVADGLDPEPICQALRNAVVRWGTQIHWESSRCA